MVFRNIVPSHLSSLSLQQALELTNVYLENAYRIKDHDVALVLCHEAEAALSQAKNADKKYPGHPNDSGYHLLREGVATAYIDLGKYLHGRGYPREGTAICKKAEKWSSGSAHNLGRLAQLSRPGSIADAPTEMSPIEGCSQNTGSTHTTAVSKIKQRPKDAIVPAHIFAENVRPPVSDYKLPQSDERLTNTPQLVCCLGLLQASHSPDEIIELDAQKWLQSIEKDTDEQERLHALSKDLIRVFMKDELKDAKAVAEVVCLAPVLSKEAFNDLIREFHSSIDHSRLLNLHMLEGMAQLIQGADNTHLNADDLVKILELFSNRLKDTHHQSTHHVHQLTLAVSHVLDAMADTKVTGLDRVKLHEPLSTYLGGLMKSTDPFLVYQAAYAYQALLCVPDNETTWQAAMRRTGTVIKGVAGLVGAAKGFDLEKFIAGLTDIQQGLGGVSKVIEVVKSGYDDIVSLAKGGQGFVECLKQGLSFESRREWYAALRGADILIRDGELATFKKLVCEAPCRYDPAFQWGVSQRLGEMAANPVWDAVIRRNAIAFLGEMYRDDDMWGHHASVRQWILNILIQLASTGASGVSGSTTQLHAIVAEKLLQDLQECGDVKKQGLYRECRSNGPITYPLKIILPELASPSLLDRVQNRPDVEGNMRVLRKQRTKERGNAVYIPPQAKANLQTSDDARFPLMERVKTFLESDQQVFLLLGDSGAGKSTFSRELEFELWKEYESKKERIPLHINLPAIEKPEHDMIAKQLRKAEFTEPQIREMKHHRKFIVICDGYDEGQQTQNLYMTNKLNHSGEWDAKMVISCRSEYLGSDYRDRFQPGGDRNTRSDSSLFQEAVIAPFTMDQVQVYIQQYVTIHQPLWRVQDYRQALDLIPSLKDLVKNPFLMTLSLDVLPRMVDPGAHLSTTSVTRVALYDHFVEQWLERGKKRLSEKEMNPQTKTAFERLSAGGFTLSGIEYLKRIAVAIYREQGGNPVVLYSPLKDEGSWKDEFFKEDQKHLLLEACPLTRNGNQYRFIHRSLLEYGLARAVFDPQDWRNIGHSDHALPHRRGSTSSTLSFEMDGILSKDLGTMDQGPNHDSPLAWRTFVNDHSLMQFLEERVQQESVFKKQLLSYIEHSKLDPKWRQAASNAITILVRSGVQFNGADLRGIRIPGADLSYGEFDSAQLQGSDLRKASLRGIWMRNADLSGAQMEGVRFGELPYLFEEASPQSSAYSREGKSFAVGLYNGDISVYTTSNWEKVATLKGHRRQIRSVAFSTDAQQIASASEDCTARLWDVRTGECRYIFVHRSYVSCVVYSPSRGEIAIGCGDNTLRARDLTTGECLQTLSGHTDGVTCAAYSPLGDTVATGSCDNTVRLWNADTGDCTHIMIGHVERVWSVAYSPHGDELASSSWDDTVRLWDAESGHSRHILKHNSDVNSISYSPNGGQLASACDDKMVRIWDIETGAIRHTFTGHGRMVWTVSFSPQGTHIASGSDDNTVRLWDVSVSASRFDASINNTGSFKFQCSPNGDQLVSYGSDNTIRYLDVETGECQRTLGDHSSTVSSVAYSSQGDMIVSCDGTSIRLLEEANGTCRRVFDVRASSVAISPQGDMIASGKGSNTVELWDVRTGDTRGTLNYGSCCIGKLSFSPDGSLIVFYYHSTVEIWEIDPLARRYSMEHHAFISDVAFSPQGHQLASAADDNQVRLWDVETGDCQMILIGHTKGSTFIAYSPDGNTLISGGGNNVRIWDIASGACLTVAGETLGAIQAIACGVSSNDVYVITRSDDGSTIAWKTENEGNNCQLIMKWFTTSGALVVTRSTIQGVRGLSQLNKQLLKQRGTQGEPVYQLQEASSKVVAMASVVSRLKHPTFTETSGTSANGDQPGDQGETQVE